MFLKDDEYPSLYIIQRLLVALIMISIPCVAGSNIYIPMMRVDLNLKYLHIFEIQEIFPIKSNNSRCSIILLIIFHDSIIKSNHTSTILKRGINDLSECLLVAGRRGGCHCSAGR